MAEFCRIHAFYDCPICRGEEVVWVIPIVDGADPLGHGGNVVGVIEIPESFEDDLAHYEVPWEGEGQLDPPVPIPAAILSEEPPDDLMQKVMSVFDWRNTPEMQEAAARGRKVHEDALTLTQEDPTISYQEAIEQILAGRDDD